MTPENPPLPPALAVLPGGAAALAEEGAAHTLSAAEARRGFARDPVIVAHASVTAQRLGLQPPSRTRDLYDALELYAFVRPAQFCAPTAAGLARALGLAEPKGAAAQARALLEGAGLLLDELARNPRPSREEALAAAQVLDRAGWAWAPLVLRALLSAPVRDRRGSGLDVWRLIPEWEDEAPGGEPGSAPVAPDAARRRLAELLARAGLDEARPDQAAYAAESAHVFQPRDAEGAPHVLLAEAGTGVGKTLGYLAPASLWAEANGPAVWVSTYTRALQRQIAREAATLFPDPVVRARRVVVRKGRENYACLLNYQEMVGPAQTGGGGDLVGLALTARWLRFTRDGDMTGGDYPAWLPGLFAVSAGAAASPANLVDRRGECVHAGCPHYRACFVEKAIRGSRRADLVVANHALVMTHAAFDGARVFKDSETARIKRIVFDEGHHLFDAADSAFAACLSGQEAAELRRWIRGPEGRGRRGRGLDQRLGDLVAGREEAERALTDVLAAATRLPAEGWPWRIGARRTDDELFDAKPSGPIEAFLAAVLEQLRARAEPSDLGMECHVRPVLDPVAEAAAEAARAVALIEAPLVALARALEAVLDDETAELPGADRARIEGALRGLDRRARMALPAWRAMLHALTVEDGEPDPDFVDWFEARFHQGSVVDAAYRRHWIDPTIPLEAAVLKPAHGVLVTSATLTDPSSPEPFALAEMRTGAARLPEPPRVLKLASPFDYAASARAFVVTDVGRDDPRQVAAAMRELFLAADGGAMGLFTAIRRLRAVYDRIAPALAEAGLTLHAQHVAPLEVGALVDAFRAEEDSCLLGTDAVRDGMDVPGRSLRLIVFDRTPWPRPDILHKARRARFGGKAHDDATARGRIAQAFGRLIRRADDQGVFVMLDAATPSRLFTSLPPGVAVQRVELVEAIEATAAFLQRTPAPAD